MSLTAAVIVVLAKYSVSISMLLNFSNFSNQPSSTYRVYNSSIGILFVRFLSFIVIAVNQLLIHAISFLRPGWPNKEYNVSVNSSACMSWERYRIGLLRFRNTKTGIVLNNWKNFFFYVKNLCQFKYKLKDNLFLHCVLLKLTNLLVGILL